jgi:uroporphyrinogen-III synthase
MFVSPAAVRFGVPLLLGGRPWPEALPQTLAAATGPGTAAALRAAGVPPGQLVQPPTDAPQFDSEALWAVLGPLRDWQGVPVGIVRGQSAGHGAADKDNDGEPGVGRAWLADRWRAAGAQVHEWVAYARRAPMASPERQALFDQVGAEPRSFAWLASSAEALGHWPVEVDVRRQVVLATHPAIAEVCTQMGFGRVLTCRPQVEAVASVWAEVVATLD